MQIVINIDDDIAHGIIDGQNDEPRDIVRSFQATIADTIKNGTPLLKGHGRLIDADEVIKPMNCYMLDKNKSHTTKMVMSIAKGLVELQKTVIKADEDESEEPNANSN